MNVDAKNDLPKKMTPPKIYPPNFFFLKSIFKNVLGSIDSKKMPPPKKNDPPKKFTLQNFFSLN